MKLKTSSGLIIKFRSWNSNLIRLKEDKKTEINLICYQNNVNQSFYTLQYHYFEILTFQHYVPSIKATGLSSLAHNREKTVNNKKARHSIASSIFAMYFKDTTEGKMVT